MPSVFSMPFCWGGPIVPEKIILTGIVTLASGIQLIYFARRVYKAREKHNIEFPATTGHPEFERTYRAQQNVLEWNPVFMTTLWTTTLFLHQVPAAICGVLYIISRQRYFNGYTRSVQERMPGFVMGARILMVMTVMSAVGIGRTLFRIIQRHHHHVHNSLEGMTPPWRGGGGVGGGGPGMPPPWRGGEGGPGMPPPMRGGGGPPGPSSFPHGGRPGGAHSYGYSGSPAYGQYHY